jgi:hypothetical protein
MILSEPDRNRDLEEKNMHTFNTNVQNWKIVIHSTDRSFLKFVSLNLPDLPGSSSAPKEKRLICEFLGYKTIFHPVDPSFQKGSGIRTLITSGIVLSESGILWNSSRFSLTANWENEDSLIVRCIFHERIDHTFRRCVLNQRYYKYNNFQVIMRALIYMPLFWWMENVEGKFVLHGAGVSKAKRGVILSGLNGVGKSTLALRMVQQGYKFAGDNYLLYDDERFYAFPEATRISSTTVKNLGISDSNHIQLYGKNLIPANHFPLVPEISPDLFLIVIRGKETKLQSISTDRALDMVLTQGDFLSEYPEHSYIGLTGFSRISQQDRVRMEKKISTTREILNKCQAGLLQLGENEPAEKAISLIECF